MRYASVCSGVEAASLAWMPLGWEAAWFSEIELFPCAVLAERFPNVPNLGDMTKISIQTNGDITYGADAVIFNDGRAIDLIVGGTPCQDASVAGKRAGLVEGERSKLAFTFTRLAYELAAYRGLRWVVWENVPGVFSLNRGRDFAMFLSSIAGRNVEPPKDGWGTFGIVPEGSRGNFGLCWRVLDVQYVRVDGFPRAIPQRRRRVFLVGYIGDWRRAAEVLFEQSRMCGDNPPSRTSRKGTAEDTEGRAEKADESRATAGTGADVMATLQANMGTGGGNEPMLCQNAYEHHPQDSRVKETEVAPTCGVFGNSIEGKDCLVLQQEPTIQADGFKPINSSSARSLGYENNNSPTIDTSQNVAIVVHGSQDPISNTEHANAVNRNNGLENYVCELKNKGENDNGNAKETRPIEILRILRSKIGKEAFCQWAARRLKCFHEKKVLQSDLHGEGVRCETDKNIGDFHMPLPCEKDCPAWSLRDMRSGICNGCPSQGQGFHEQRAEQSDEGLQELPQQAAPSKESVCDMWKTAEGAWLLRQALAEIQKIWKSIHGQRQNCYRGSVRRLMPIECERLQGMPDNWTQIPWRGKPAEECPDAPRYKACGNSMGVNCMRWIGLGIEAAEAKHRQ